MGGKLRTRSVSSSHAPLHQRARLHRRLGLDGPLFASWGLARFAADYVPSCALAINDVIHPPMNHSLRDAPDA